MARVDVPVMVEDKVRLWEGGRAVDALWGAVLEADAADDVGDALVLRLNCLCGEVRISTDGVKRGCNRDVIAIFGQHTLYSSGCQSAKSSSTFLL